MYTLRSEALEVSILDPLADQERLGARYCTGGYIFQITDSQHGALLSGPTYPESFNWFDGQGIPDAFNLSPLRDSDTPAHQTLIIGVGVCDLQARQVNEFCHWEVQAEESQIVMRTTQTFHRFALELERTVSLQHRSVRSATRLQNTGKLPIPIHWFPHPFFPHPQTDELCRFNIPVHMPANAGYELGENGFIMRKGWPWQAGPYQALDHAAQTNLVVLQKHPSLGLIAATCSYIPGYFPIWGNRQTFSWEPFLERTLGVAQETSWWIDYDF
ncbi:MAG: hypothetical protein H0X37_24195 [Herpetosiphonaceae bacterium]|nr:hypothetical protein [Herpetosiphonaceae bacterium]